MEKNNAKEQPNGAKKRSKIETKKLLVYLSFVLIFLVVLWLILAPKDKGLVGSDTLNTLVPESTDVEIEDDKTELYATEDQIRATEEKDSALVAQVTSASAVLPGMDGSAQASQTTQDEDKYGFNYKPDESAYWTSELYQKQDEIETLKRENQELKDLANEYMGYVEKMQEESKKEPSSEELLETYRRQKEIDYELAERYSPKEEPVDLSKTNPAVSKVQLQPSRRNVVSSLDVPLTDSLLIERLSQDRNFGFYTMKNGSDEVSVPRNALRVEVDRTVILKPGDYLPLRLQEDVWIEGAKLPRGTRLVGVARLSDNRMKVIVNSIEYQDRIFSTGLTAFDVDGQEGLYVPLSAETSAIREAAGAVAQSPMNGGISFNNSSAREQILTDVARSLIRGGAGYVNKKVSEVRITVKAGYRLYLVPSKR